MNYLTCAALAVLMPVAALADDAIAITDPYARSANPQSGAAFMLIENQGATACHLQAAASEAAERVELHTHEEVDGVMKMVEIEGGIDIPAAQSHLMQRGGDHVMFLGLVQPLEDGDVVTLTLDFGDCGSKTIELPVDNRRQPAEMPE